MGTRSDSTYPSGRTFTDRDGVLHVTGQTVDVISTAVNRTMTVDESGSIVVVTAADKVITLPATALGLTYTITLGNGGISSGTGLSVSPVAADKINAKADDADLVNTGATDVIGDSVTVTGDGAGGWYTTGQRGIWA